MTEWPEVLIQDISEKVAMGPFGSSIKVETFVPIGIPIISGAHLRGTRLDDGVYNYVSDEHSRKLANSNVRRGDVVFTHAGNIGQVAYIPETSKYEKYVLSQRQFFLRCDKSKALPEFIVYFFKTREGLHKLLANASQVGVPSIARPSSHLKTIRLRLPPLETQRQIVSVLGALDDKIDLNRRMNETLEAMARAFFKDWFVDFGPVRAKMGSRAPHLAPEVWALFPDRLDDGGKPEGWDRLSLRDAADVLSGGTPNKEDARFWGGALPWISPKAMMGIHVSKSDEQVTELAIGNGTRLAPAGSVLLMVRGMGLHLGVRVSQARRDVTFNQDVKALVPKRVSADHLLFGMLDAASSLFSKVEASGHGTGRLPTDIIEKVEFVVPPKATYERLLPMLQQLNDKIALNDAESETLAATRDLLLPKLMSGEIRIRDAGKIVEAVA